MKYIRLYVFGNFDLYRIKLGLVKKIMRVIELKCMGLWINGIMWIVLWRSEMS